MKIVTTSLQTLLDNNQYYKCLLYTITLVSGTVYYYTDADIDVVAYGQTYSSKGPDISGAEFHLTRGLQTDTINLKVTTQPSDLIAGVSWSTAARSGALDNASIKIDKAFLPAWVQPAESLNFFNGVVSGIQDGELTTTLSVVSDDSLFDIPLPKLLFQPGCVRTLYSPGCTMVRATYQKSGNVTVATSASKFTTNLADADGYYNFGSLTFTGGANTGVKRSVKSYIGGVIELSTGLNFPVTVGDTFTAVAGCDKSQGSGGCLKFNNLANHKGLPYIPKPETMV